MNHHYGWKGMYRRQLNDNGGGISGDMMTLAVLSWGRMSKWMRFTMENVECIRAETMDGYRGSGAGKNV